MNDGSHQLQLSIRMRYVWIALSCFVLLLVIGLLNLKNVAEYSGATFHQTQLLWILLGLAISLAVLFIDLKFFQELSPLFYWGGIALLILLLFLGKEVNNAKRWFDLGDFNFQPSEYMKPALVLFLARFFHVRHNPERYTLRMLLKPLGYMALPAILILIEPDLGTSLIIIAVGFSIMFFEGVRFRSFLLLLGIILLIIPLAWEFNIIQPYQKERVRVWLSIQGPRTETRKRVDKAMQPEQALWAVGSGRLLGKGSGKGVQSALKYLPEMHTDYILATYAEERGFVGCVFLLLLYFLLILSMMRIAVSCRERFSVLVGIGAMSIIGWQVVFNVGMVLGLFPVVGLTLPFMSYGGSSTISAMFSVALVLNTGIHKGAG